jgi:hypothetical protein
MSCALRTARIAARRNDVGLEALSRSLFLAIVGLLAALFFISQMHSKLLWGLLALAPALLSIARHEDATEPLRLETAGPPALTAGLSGT